MRTRGRPQGEEIWPRPGPLSSPFPTDFRCIEKHTRSRSVDAIEKKHFAKCQYHFNYKGQAQWERRWWSQQVRRHDRSLESRCSAVLACGNRCGRPFLRSDQQDIQWFCTGHASMLPKPDPLLLQMPREIRDRIYTLLFLPFLLVPRNSAGHTQARLLQVNRMIYEEAMESIYSRTTLALVIEFGDMQLHYDYRIACVQPDDLFGYSRLLAKLLQSNVVSYVRKLEISLNESSLSYPRGPVFSRFLDVFRQIPISCFVVKFTADLVQGHSSGFQELLRLFSAVPGSVDIVFFVSNEFDDLERTVDVASLVSRARMLNNYAHKEQ